MLRDEYSASSGLWVTKIMVRPRACSSLKEHEDAERGAGVEIAGGLVGEDYHRVVDEGAGYGHALLLSARHLVALVVEALGESHGLKRKRIWPARARSRDDTEGL